MSGMQIRTVVLSIILIVFDGYDMAVMSFTGPYIRHEYASSGSMLGYVFSGSLVGMFLGSTFVAPIADRIGRRKVAIVSALIVALGMAIGPLGQDIMVLLASRVVTGLGIGSLVAAVGVILSEFTSRKAYSVTMALYAAAINIGAVLGAMLVGPFLNMDSIANMAYPFGGWRFAFLIGAGLAVLAALGTIALFPESITWISESARPGALEKLNVLLSKMGQKPVTELEAPAAKEEKGSIRTVMTPGLRWRTFMMLAGYTLYMVTFYFVNNWAPTTVASGHNGDMSLAAPTLASTGIGGILGTLLFGVISTKANPRIVTPIFLVLGTLGLAWFGFAGTAIPMVFIVAGIASFFFAAGTGGFYSIIPKLYPTLARATGYGFVIGVGRLGGVIGPILGGYAIDAQWSQGTLYTVFALPLLIAAGSIFALHIGSKRSKIQIDEPVH